MQCSESLIAESKWMQKFVHHDQIPILTGNLGRMPEHVFSPFVTSRPYCKYQNIIAIQVQNLCEWALNHFFVLGISIYIYTYFSSYWATEAAPRTGFFWEKDMEPEKSEWDVHLITVVLCGSTMFQHVPPRRSSWLFPVEHGKLAHLREMHAFGVSAVETTIGVCSNWGGSQLMAIVHTRFWWWIPDFGVVILSRYTAILGHDCRRGDQGDSTLRVSLLRSHAWTDLCGGSTLRCEKGQ